MENLNTAAGTGHIITPGGDPTVDGDTVCDYCSVPLLAEPVHVGSDPFVYEKRVCTSNPDHYKLIPLF